MAAILSRAQYVNTNYNMYKDKQARPVLPRHIPNFHSIEKL